MVLLIAQHSSIAAASPAADTAAAAEGEALSSLPPPALLCPLEFRIPNPYLLSAMLLIICIDTVVRGHRCHVLRTSHNEVPFV